MNLGNVLAQLRNSKGLNQREFAQLLGVSNGAVAMWETNKRQPDLETIKKIADFYEVTTDFLLGKETITQNLPIKNHFNAITGAINNQIGLTGLGYDEIAKK